MASAAVDDLQVVAPAEVDRGPWPWFWRIGAAVLAGLTAWLAARLAARLLLRRRG